MDRKTLPPVLNSKSPPQGLFYRLRIRQKIGYGYALAIGIAILGTITGRLIEYHHKDMVRKQVGLDTETAHILTSLNHAVLELRIEQQELIFWLKKPDEFNKKSSTFLGSLKQIIQILEQVKSLGKNADSRLMDFTDQKQFKNLQQFSQDYADAVAAYSQQLKALLEQISQLTEKSDGLTEAQGLLLNFANSEVALKLNKFSQDSGKLANQFRRRASLAARAYQEAEILGGKILVGSLIVSAAIATVLAIYTSRAIAHPIETTVKITQLITKESRFDIYVPVMTKDEVGLLTIALNQLIQRVAEYTGELYQKNQELQQAYDKLTQALSELQQTQAQLIHTEKMSSLGHLVAGVAHEINNPVNFIYGNLTYANEYIDNLLDLIKLYQKHYPNPVPEIQDQAEAIELDFLIEDLPKSLASMKMGAERIRQIVLSLRNFSRLDESEIKLANLHEGIDNTLSMLNHRFSSSDIELIKIYGELPRIECSPAQLNQAFMNIIDNAIDALIEQKNQSKKQLIIHTEIVEFNQFKIRIKDNGPGIPPDIKSKIFDPFFTTKPPGKGTGLGLAISYQIIKNHRGNIDVICQPNQGTEFVITLPITKVSV